MNNWITGTPEEITEQFHGDVTIKDGSLYIGDHQVKEATLKPMDEKVSIPSKLMLLDKDKRFVCGLDLFKEGLGKFWIGGILLKWKKEGFNESLPACLVETWDRAEKILKHGEQTKDGFEIHVDTDYMENY